MSKIYGRFKFPSRKNLNQGVNMHRIKALRDLKVINKVERDLKKEFGPIADFEIFHDKVDPEILHWMARGKIFHSHYRKISGLFYAIWSKWLLDDSPFDDSPFDENWTCPEIDELQKELEWLDIDK